MKWNKSIITVWIIQIIRGENLKKWKTFSFEWWKLSSGWSVLSRPPIQFLFFFPFQLFLMSWMKKKRELTGSGRPLRIEKWVSERTMKQREEDGRQSILFNQSNFFWLNERELWALQLTPPTNQINEINFLCWLGLPLPPYGWSTKSIQSFNSMALNWIKRRLIGDCAMFT